MLHEVEFTTVLSLNLDKFSKAFLVKINVKKKIKLSSVLQPLSSSRSPTLCCHLYLAKV